MPRTPARPRLVQRSSRHLLGLLVGVTAALAIALIWLSVEILGQDRIVAEQQRDERLQADADRILRLLERQLSDAESTLQSAADDASRVITWRTGGTVMRFTPGSMDRLAGRALAFLPVLPSSIEPRPDAFAEAEAAEFRDRDYARAADVYTRVAASSDPTTRAAAVIGLGRVLRKADRDADALRVYRDIAGVQSVRVMGLPADLLARDAATEVLQRIGRAEDARAHAKAIVSDLLAAKWILAAGQYQHYLERASSVAGVPAPPDGLVAARSVDTVFHRWRADLPARGRLIERDGGTSVLTAWSATSECLVVWVIDSSAFLSLVPPETSVSVVLGDDRGVVAGRADGTGRPVTRTGPESRLPWTLQVAQNSAISAAGDPLRRRFVLGGLSAMLLMLIAGAIAIGRAVHRERALAQAQSDFVAAVSHEFRTPLAAMRQLSELLAEGRVADDAKRTNYYHSLAGESRRLQRLVENLLNFGRMDSGDAPYKPEPVDPNGLIDDVIAGYRTQLATPDCRIEVARSDQQSDGPLVLADREAVALALHNLIDNAVKYSGNRPVHVSWEQRRDSIAISVRDEGPGIAADEQRRIFQRFVRGAAAQAGRIRGTGLGLAMVQLVVDGHGGRVTLESTPGAGATFAIILPAAHVARTPPMAEEATT